MKEIMTKYPDVLSHNRGFFSENRVELVSANTKRQLGAEYMAELAVQPLPILLDDAQAR